MTNKLGSSNPNRIPKPKSRISKDVKYLGLIRKLQRAERMIQEVIPISVMDVKWEDYGIKPSGLPYKQNFEDLLPTELQKINYRRLRQAREDIYWEIYDFLGKEKFLEFFKEYHNLKVVDMGEGIPMLKPANPIGQMIMGGEGALYVAKDNLPITYEVLDKYPINDGNVKSDEAYRIRINALYDLTINRNMYKVIQYVKDNYGDGQRFHFPELLRDLEIDEIITSDYDGNPNQLFRTRKGLLHILFKPDELKEKGMWTCRVKYWI